MTPNLFYIDIRFGFADSPSFPALAEKRVDNRCIRTSKCFIRGPYSSTASRDLLHGSPVTAYTSFLESQVSELFRQMYVSSDDG